MKQTLIIEQPQIEEAIRKYIGDHLSAGYKFVFNEWTLTFELKDGKVVCTGVTDIVEKETE